MTTAGRHPLARAAERLGFQLDVVTVLEAVGQEIDTRVTTLLTESDPATFLLERDAIVRRVGATTAGINTEAYASWWGRLVGTLNAETKRHFPDWPTREGLLLNPYMFVLGGA